MSKPGYADIYKMWLGHEKKFIKTMGALGTVGSRNLVKPSGVGVVVSTLECIDTLGVNAKGEGYTTGYSMRVQVTGVGKVEAGEAISFGKRLKCIGAGKVGQFIDADLAGEVVGDATALAGDDFANQPANDTVDVASDAAGDTTQTVTVYGLENGGTTIETDTYVLTGAATIAGTVSFDTVLAIVVDAACAGTLTITENSGGATIDTMAAGVLQVGMNAITAGLAYYGIPDVVSDGASTKVIGIVGTSTTGAALSEQKTLTGATKVALANSYATITMVLTGDVESAQAVEVSVADEEDDENACVGKSVEAATADGDIIEYIIQ